MSIQMRRGTQSKRLASTEVLLAGQPFFEKDTNKLYIGDGTTQLKSLNKVEANDSDAAHLSASNTFTGSNKFEGTVNFSKITEGAISFAGRPSFNAGIELVTGVLSFRDKTATLPSATGTLALADDNLGSVVQFKENTLIGSKCSLTRDVTTWIKNGYGSYCSPGFLVAGYGSGNSSGAAGTTAIGPDGIYKLGSRANTLKFTLPDEAGTLVTTAGSNIFTGINTFQQSTSADTETKSGEIVITPNTTTPHVTVSATTTLGGLPETDKTEIDSAAVTITNSASVFTKYCIGKIIYGPTDQYTLNLPSKSGTLALTKDIPIKSATLSGTTLSITLS